MVGARRSGSWRWRYRVAIEATGSGLAQDEPADDVPLGELRRRVTCCMAHFALTILD